MAILTDIHDPRVSDVTVTYVEVTADLRQAKVHVSVMGDDAKGRLCLRGLQSSAGFLQSKIASRIDTRYTPQIRFELDMGVKNSIAMTRLLGDLLEDPSAPLPEAQAPDAQAPEANETTED